MVYKQLAGNHALCRARLLQAILQEPRSEQNLIFLLNLSLTTSPLFVPVNQFFLPFNQKMKKQTCAWFFSVLLQDMIIMLNRWASQFQTLVHRPCHNRFNFRWRISNSQINNLLGEFTLPVDDLFPSALTPTAGLTWTQVSELRDRDVRRRSPRQTWNEARWRGARAYSKPYLSRSWTGWDAEPLALRSLQMFSLGAFFIKSAFRNVYSPVHVCFHLICAPRREGVCAGEAGGWRRFKMSFLNK